MTDLRPFREDKSLSSVAEARLARNQSELLGHVMTGCWSPSKGDGRYPNTQLKDDRDLVAHEFDRLEQQTYASPDGLSRPSQCPDSDLFEQYISTSPTLTHQGCIPSHDAQPLHDSRHEPQQQQQSTENCRHAQSCVAKDRFAAPEIPTPDSPEQQTPRIARLTSPRSKTGTIPGSTCVANVVVLEAQTSRTAQDQINPEEARSHGGTMEHGVMEQSLKDGDGTARTVETVAEPTICPESPRLFDESRHPQLKESLPKHKPRCSKERRCSESSTESPVEELKMQQMCQLPKSVDLAICLEERDMMREKLKSQNRDAAMRYRKRARQQTSTLRDMEKRLQERRKLLKAEMSKLSDERLQMKNLLINHTSCGFRPIDVYHTLCAQSIVEMDKDAGMTSAKAAGLAMDSSAETHEGEDASPQSSKTMESAPASPITPGFSEYSSFLDNTPSRSACPVNVEKAGAVLGSPAQLDVSSWYGTSCEDTDDSLFAQAFRDSMPTCLDAGNDEYEMAAYDWTSMSFPMGDPMEETPSATLFSFEQIWPEALPL